VGARAVPAREAVQGVDLTPGFLPVIDKVGRLHGKLLNQYLFQAIVSKHDVKNNKHLCWRDSAGTLTKYSNEVPAWLLRLSPKEVDDAITDYRRHLSSRREQRSKTTVIEAS